MKKHQLIAELIEDMFAVDWFANEYTHGCYAEEDFRGDIVHLPISELEALRKYQIEALDPDLFYEHVWTGEEIVYKDFGCAA